MVYPKDEIVYKNLSTAFIDLPALLSTLKSEKFSGTLEIGFPKNKGTFFILSGNVINAQAWVGMDLKGTVGPDAIQALLALGNQKDGVLDLYRLPPQQITLLANSLQSEILFKGLSTDFARLDRLLVKLKEDRHDGFVEILSRNHQAIGILYLAAGEPVEVLTKSSDSQTATVDQKSISSFVENIMKQSAILNIYKTSSRIEEKREEIQKVKEEPPAEIKARVQELIPFFEEVLAKAEKLIDGATKKGTFLTFLQKSLMEHSPTYGFLDPFVGEFEYREGAIHFTGEVKERDFAGGLVDCLRAILGSVEEELPKGRLLINKFRVEIESSLRKHQDGVKRLGMGSVVSPLLE
jgi:hypothetical protein